MNKFRNPARLPSVTPTPPGRNETAPITTDDRYIGIISNIPRGPQHGQSPLNLLQFNRNYKERNMLLHAAQVHFMRLFLFFAVHEPDFSQKVCMSNMITKQLLYNNAY